MVLESVHNEALTKALNRANARGLEVHPRHEIRKGANVAQWFEVASFSARGTYHNVRLCFTANGIDFSCDCQAGQVGRMCQHAAAALAANGFGPAPELETEPEPVAPKHSNVLQRLQSEGKADRAAIYGGR